MTLASTPLSLILAFCTTAIATVAQEPGAAAAQSNDSRVLLRYATFDPLTGTPEVPPALHSAADTGLWIVQFHGAPTDHDREVVGQTGAILHGYLPHNAYIVRMGGGTAAAVAVLREVRWVGAYEPAYRLERELLAEHLTGAQMPVRRYNLVMTDKRREKQALEAKIVAMGGKVVDRHLGGLLFTAELTGVQLLAAARLDEVLYIDRWTESGNDMDNARIQGGGNAIETAAGYTGSGIRGHIYEGAEATHTDFTTALTNVRSGGAADDHGHCTAGIVFGNGTSAAQARGMAPDARGFYTNYGSVTAGWSRNMVIDDVVNVHQCMFTTASWGGAQTSAYTSVSADADDIVFDHRIPWTNSMSNLGNTLVRPEAWAKNVISIGGVQHFNNSTAGDDSWAAGNGSIGPAADGRNKPDLAAYYDSVWTSDRTGAAGYTTGNSYTGFGGTSAATPIVAGHNALAIQMYTDHIFNNTPRVASGTRFQNRPYAQTLKALMIVGATPYAPQAADNRREHVGWGFPNLNTLYTRRARFTVIPEDTAITQGSTHTYLVNVLNGETSLKACMTFLDPAGNPAAAIDRINDLSLRVIHPNGTTAYWGNVGLVGAGQANVSATGGSANTLDTVECVFVNNPTPGTWTIEVSAPTVAQDANLATPAVDATYALVVNGGIRLYGSGCARYIPDISATGTENAIPFGSYADNSLPTLFATNNGGSVGGAVYFNITVTNPLYLTSLDLNSGIAAGTPLLCDVYRTVVGGGFGGNETNPAVWIPVSAGRGTAAGQNLPSHVDLTEPQFLAAGSYGIAIVARNFAHAYTNGTGGNQIYNDANLQIATGSATNAPFAGVINSPRVWNGNLRYRLDTDDWTNQRYQTILRREELGSAGILRSIAFSAADTGTHWNSQLLIRLSHVPAGHTLSSTFATNLPSPVTVLNASNYTWHVTQDSWREIGLQSPFTYNGTSDVVVDIVARGNHSSTNHAFHAGPQSRVFAYAWSGATPTTGTVGTSSGLRMRVGFNCANAGKFGTSCGPLRAEPFGIGTRGSTFWYDVYEALPNDAAILAMGFNNTSPYPVSLNSYGFTNCEVWTDIVATVLHLTSGSGSAIHAVSVPNDPGLDGLRIHGQWFQLDATQPGGLTASNYVSVRVGLTP